MFNQSWPHLGSIPMQIGDLTLLEPYRGQTLFVACSGGLDSMVLAYWLLENGFNIELMHVNYHKRAEQSDLDQFLVEKFAQTFHIPCHVKHFKHEESTGNFQQIARLFRYNFFEKIAGKGKIITAHHQDDFIETFFLQLDRGAGMKGLRSILPENNNRLRPFLNTSKSELRKYAEEKGIPWRDDVSNFESEYIRNRWRNIFIPFLNEQQPHLTESILILTKAFAESYEWEKEKLAPLAKQIQGELFLSKMQVEALSTNDWYILLEQFKQPKWAIERFENIAQTKAGAKLDLEMPFDWAYWNERGLYFKMKFEDFTAKEIQIEELSQLPSTFYKSSVYLDPSKIKGNLRARVWQEEDSIEPIGLKGKQNVAKVIKDAAIPLPDRANIYVLHDDVHILWVENLKVSRKAIATKETTKIWKVSLKELEVR